MAFPFLSGITLNSDLDSINNSIQNEHISWVKGHVLSFIMLDHLEDDQYGVLNYPQLWSGIRYFETQVDTLTDVKTKNGEYSFKAILEKVKNLLPWMGSENNKEPAFNEIKKLIKKAKKDHPTEKKDIEEFEKEYKKIFANLKERCLLQAINTTLDTIDSIKSEDTKNKFRNIFNTSSLLNMQTRFDCLKAHRDIDLVCNELKKNEVESDAQEKIERLKVLSKRLVDAYYANTKKLTLGDAIAKDINTITSFIGLAAGITAAILAILSFAFPPLALPATILGFISFISYASTIISTIKMAHEAAEFGRGPNPRDVKWVIVDVLLAPLNIIGSLIFAKLADLFHGDKVKSIVNLVGFAWDNIISNVFPDAIDTKAIASNMLDVGSSYTGKGRLKDTTTATSWQKIRSAMIQDNQDFDKVNIAKESSRINGETAKYERDFSYVHLANNKAQTELPFTKSYHGHILLWDHGFIGSGTSIRAQNIKNAVEKYKRLKPDCTIQNRVDVLNKIQNMCGNYLDEYQACTNVKGRYSYVENLASHVKTERDNLKEVIAQNAHDSTVLVGFKTR